MKPVKTEFIRYPKTDQHGTRHPDRQTQNINGCKYFIPAEIADCDDEKVFDHFKKVKINCKKFSAANCQLPTVNRQPSTVNRQPSTFNRHRISSLSLKIYARSYLIMNQIDTGLPTR
jgi:hypothetical protein